MKSLQECYNEIYETLNGFNENAASIMTEMEERLQKRSEEIPARIENLQIRLKMIDEYESRILDLVKLAKMHITSLNLPTIEVPFGYRINLNRLLYWSKMIDPMSEDDVYAQRIYLVGSCDLEFLNIKREEYRAKIVQLDDDYNKSAPEEIKKLEDAYQEILKSKKEYLESDEFTGFANRVVSEQKNCIISELADENDFLQYPLDGIDEEKKYFKSLFADFYDEELGVLYLTKITPEDQFFEKNSEDESVEETDDKSLDDTAESENGTENGTDEITEFVKE